MASRLCLVTRPHVSLLLRSAVPQRSLAQQTPQTLCVDDTNGLSGKTRRGFASGTCGQVHKRLFAMVAVELDRSETGGGKGMVLLVGERHIRAAPPTRG